jgi:hypothetical protein
MLLNIARIRSPHDSGKVSEDAAGSENISLTDISAKRMETPSQEWYSEPENDLIIVAGVDTMFIDDQTAEWNRVTQSDRKKRP